VSEERYTRTAMWLHWLIGAAVLAQIGFGRYLQSIPRGTPDRTIFVNYHKSVGITIGLLIVVRIAWRLAHKPPPLPASMPLWERYAALANHGLLYACMLLMPITGYVASNFSKFGVKFFNLVLLPPWGADDRGIYEFFNGLHLTVSYVLMLLIAIHVLAALKHILYPRHGILRRMLPS
jgi:cytochrome b561